MRAHGLLAAALVLVGAASELSAPQGGLAEVTPTGSVIVRAEPTPHTSPESGAPRLVAVAAHAPHASAVSTAGASRSTPSLLEAAAASAKEFGVPFGAGASRYHDEGATVTTTPKARSKTVTYGEHKVSCGGHTTTRCRLCTIVDPETGFEIPDKGPDWCHGDCKYIDGECERSHGGNANIEHQADPNSDPASTTQHIPDLLNPNITDEDRKLMAQAADRAIQEANYEAKKRQMLEALNQDRKKDWKDNVIYVAIMTASCLLACCACGAVAAAVKYILAPGGSKTPLAETDEVNDAAASQPQA